MRWQVTARSMMSRWRLQLACVAAAAAGLGREGAAETRVQVQSPRRKQEAATHSPLGAALMPGGGSDCIFCRSFTSRRRAAVDML